ncbi:MAG: glycosyltransferase [Anaerolineae bacterium]|nr:glycosyltransferase [Anaerolineae bacterium]
MRILGFGYDTNLLLPEEATNESQYRQRRYCELLGQEKAIVILNTGFPYRERSLAGGLVWAIGVSARHKWLQVARAYVQGIRIGRQFRPDVVEYQDPRLAGLVAYLVARTLGVPLVGGVFNDLLDNPVWLGRSAGRRLYNRVGKFVLSRSLLVRCDSSETTRALNRKGYHQVRYVPFFVPWLEKFCVSDEAIRDRLQRWDEEPVVLCVARLSEEKNIPLLLQAFRQVYMGSRRGRLVIVGSGPLRDGLERLERELGIEQRLSWEGFVDFPVLVQHFHRANIFALSSSAESSARVLIQAQAARLPTVTTATSGSRDIVSDGQTGYVTPVGDVEAFARALDRLLNDRVTYRRMLESDAYRALEQHGEQVITGELRMFYDSLSAAR